MPLHLLHLLQSLDVGCFLPLKHAYGSEISNLARQSTTHITKMNFLAAIKSAFFKAFTTENICGSFRGAGLVSFDPEAVVLQLDLRLRMPTPSTPDTILEPQTPHTAYKLQSQSSLIRERIQRHQNSSPTSIVELLNRFTRGAKMMAHSAVLIRDQVSTLQKAAEVATKRKSRKRRYEEGAQLATPEDNSPQELEERLARRVCKSQGAPHQRHCRRCNKTGHIARTCKEVL